jgi:hypothetical protein
VLELGLAGEDITPEEPVPLFGYGDRTHDSQGVHDPLYAYVWWVRCEGVPPFVWLVLDLCVLSPGSARLLSADIWEGLGDREVDLERILISTTHTHSGPDTWNIAEDSRSWARRYYQRLVERSTAAVCRARDGARAGFLEIRTGRGALGVNRRDPKLPVDPRIVLLSMVDAGGGLRGVLFHYSCHLTVLGVDNYQISADWLGPVRSRLEQELGVPVAFVQGAEGNVDPAPRGALDMADPEQARGSSFEVLERLAAELSESILAALDTPVIAKGDRLETRSVQTALPLRDGPLTEEEVLKKVHGWKGDFASFLDIPVEEVPEDFSINARIKQRCRELESPSEEVRHWVARQFAYTAFLHLVRGTPSGEADLGPGTAVRSGRMPVTAKLLDFGTLVVLAVPAEVLLEAALEWQRRLSDRVALVAGLAGGWVGYLPYESNYREDGASERYETVSTVFAPEAADRLLDDAVRQLA